MSLSSALAAVTLLASAVVAPRVAAQTVPLHVRDCDVKAGGLAVLVIEVCQPRPISQGQICLDVPGIGRVRAAAVLSTNDDAVATAEIAAPNRILITFASPSATINETKGPLAIIAFRLDRSLPPGFETMVSVDLGDTEIFDAAGNPVGTEPTPGRLRVKAPDDPFVLYAFSDYGLVGDSAIVEVATRERLRTRQMTIDFEYDDDFFSSVRDVHVFPDALDLVASVDASVPGLVRVRLSSDSVRLNDVPGSLFWVELVRRPGDEDHGEIELPEETCSVQLGDGSEQPLRTIDYEVR